MKEFAKKKVLFVTASTCGGGAERMLFNIINSLDKNHTTRLIITSKEKAPDDVSTNLDVYNLNKKNARHAFGGILKHVSLFQPDYVFTTSSNIGYMLILAKFLSTSKFKVIIRCAVSPSEVIRTKLIKGFFLTFLIKTTYKWSDLLIAQTDFMKQDLIKVYKLKADKIKVIRNIVDMQFLSQSSIKFQPEELNENNINIVTAGALYSIKGFDLLIEAITPLIHAKRDIHLYILGEERYEAGYKVFLQNLIKKNDISDNVQLIGYKSNPYPYYKNADLFVMSSRKEGFPNVVLESLFLGTPVVATNCVDFFGIIYDGINGYVVGKENIEELKNAIENSINYLFDLTKYPIKNFNYNKLFI